jgi:hypothetical protein
MTKIYETSNKPHGKEFIKMWGECLEKTVPKKKEQRDDK